MNNDELEKFYEKFFLIGKNLQSSEKVLVEDSKECFTKIYGNFNHFNHGAVIDEVFEDFGGVRELMTIKWDDTLKHGEVVALMLDWRVCRVYIKDKEYELLNWDEKKRKLNHECQVWEDMDEWGKWVDDGGIREKKLEAEWIEKKRIDDISEYKEDYDDALKSFFAGDIGSLQGIMNGNKHL